MIHYMQPTGNKPFVITPAKAVEILGGVPNSDEINRLKDAYCTYDFPRRGLFLQKYFNTDSLKSLTEDRVTLEHGQQATSIQSKGGYGNWVRSKSRRLVVRLLYLRYTLDEGCTRRQANQKINQLTWLDYTQSSIRKATQLKPKEPS